MVPRTVDRQRDLRHALVVVLTLNAGATDAIGFLALGGAFTSVMTGNLVLFGISVADADVELAWHTTTAIACFIAGCVVGARLTGPARDADPIWPPSVTRTLLVQFAIFCGYAIGWWSVGGRPYGPIQLALLALNAVGLGVQSSTVQRFGVSGLSTTYMTGTLTTLVVRLTSGHRIRDVKGSMQLLVALIVGAALSCVLNRAMPGLVPLVQLVSIGSVIVVSTLLTPLRSGVAATGEAGGVGQAARAHLGDLRNPR